MYAVIQTGGKQYRVEPGSTVRVEKLAGDQGDAVEFNEIVMLSSEGEVKVGKPLVEGAKVTGEIVAQGRGDKVLVFKFKRRKNYKRKQGHRQDFTTVKINEVLVA